MTTTCLISSYNYAAYVGDAVDSALGQSVPFDQIIVVDDGSTDDSVQLLTARYRSHPLVQIISKENEGQLSCFNEGFARSKGDIVFFLDADDVLEPAYIERALDVYEGHPACDFLACGRRMFGLKEGVSLTFPTDRDLGYSVILTAFQREWIGAPTSCLSIRRRVLSQILPLPFTEDWRIRADDCLVFGASLAGARKRYLAQPLVGYRVHSKNRYCGQTTDHATIYQRRLAVNRLFEYLERTLCNNFSQLAVFLHREFCTIESPTFRELVKYIHISQSAPISIIRQLSCIGAMVHHFSRAPGRTRTPITARRPACPRLGGGSNTPVVRSQQRAA